MIEKMLIEQMRDGFLLRKIKFELPFDIESLDPKTQLDLLVCHLFVNDKCAISAITRIAVDHPGIIRALLEQGAICERRQNPRAA